MCKGKYLPVWKQTVILCQTTLYWSPRSNVFYLCNVFPSCYIPCLVIPAEQNKQAQAYLNLQNNEKDSNKIYEGMRPLHEFLYQLSAFSICLNDIMQFRECWTNTSLWLKYFFVEFVSFVLKSSHLYLYSAFNNTNCVKATAQYQKISKYQNRNIFELKAFHCWIQWCYCPAQFSLNSICAIKSVISLEIKCPQLSKPEATTPRNQNSIGDRTEKKNTYWIVCYFVVLMFCLSQF